MRKIVFVDHNQEWFSALKNACSNRHGLSPISVGGPTVSITSTINSLYQALLVSWSGSPADRPQAVLLDVAWPKNLCHGFTPLALFGHSFDPYKAGFFIWDGLYSKSIAAGKSNLLDQYKNGRLILTSAHTHLGTPLYHEFYKVWGQNFLSRSETATSISEVLDHIERLPVI